MTDLVVALFVAVLVVAALYLPRWGDALGRLARGRSPGDAPPDEPEARRERR